MDGVIYFFVAMVVTLVSILGCTLYFHDYELDAFQDKCRLDQYVNVKNEWDDYCIDPKTNTIIKRYVRINE